MAEHRDLAILRQMLGEYGWDQNLIDLTIRSLTRPNGRPAPLHGVPGVIVLDATALITLHDEQQIDNNVLDVETLLEKGAEDFPQDVKLLTIQEIDIALGEGVDAQDMANMIWSQP